MLIGQKFSVFVNDKFQFPRFQIFLIIYFTLLNHDAAATTNLEIFIK